MRYNSLANRLRRNYILQCVIFSICLLSLPALVQIAGQGGNDREATAAGRALPAITVNRSFGFGAWDTNADGTPDSWDVDGDGKPDVFDTNGDGKVDQASASYRNR